MSYRVEVFVENEWNGNGLFFPTKEEADKYGKALSQACFLVKDYKVLQSTGPANYQFIGPGNHDIKEIK